MEMRSYLYGSIITAMKSLKPAFFATLSFVALSFFSFTSWGQMENPAHWSIDLYESAEKGKVDLVFKCKLDAGWKVYSQNIDGTVGPIPTSFEYSLPEGVDKPDKVDECQPILEYDPNFMVDLEFFKKACYQCDSGGLLFVCAYPCAYILFLGVAIISQDNRKAVSLLLLSLRKTKYYENI